MQINLKPQGLKIRLPGAAALAIIALATVAVPARAEEEYAQLKFDKKWRSELTVSKVCRGELPLEGNEEKFNGYFIEYILAEMTDPEKVLQYPTLRKTFYSRYVKAAAQTPAALLQLNNLVLGQTKDKDKLDSMKTVLAGKKGGRPFHPAARYNAVLLIGELDQKVPAGIGGDNKSVPCADALEILLKAYRSKNMPEAIRAGALVGVVRHASLNVPSNRRDQLTDVMVELVAEKTPPGGRDPQVHEWLRRRAAETLAMLGQAGANNRVAVPLAEVLNDPKSSPTLRCAAADALAHLKFESAENLESAALAKQMGGLGVQLCELHARQAEDRNAKATRRELSQQLTHIQHGLQAPLVLAKFSKADGAAIEALEKQMDGGVKMLEESGEDKAALKRGLAKLVKDLRSQLGPDAAETKTPATEKPKPNKKPEIIAPEIEVDSN